MNNKLHSLFSNGGGEGILKAYLRRGFTLAEVPEARQYRSKQAAFTLAEVLITLGIIGIVAAMTVPTLMKNYQKKVFVARLQTMYSDMGQAIKLGQAEYGDVSGWDFSLSNREIFDKYLSAFKKQDVRSLADVKQHVTYYQISGKPENSFDIFHEPENTDVITLSSGATLFVLNSSSKFMIPEKTQSRSALSIIADVNGFAKPNTFGKDVFYFIIKNDGTLILPDWNDNEGIDVHRTVEQLKDPAESPSYLYQCDRNGRGLWCGALIQLSGWKIPDDYPW